MEFSNYIQACGHPKRNNLLFAMLKAKAQLPEPAGCSGNIFLQAYFSLLEERCCKAEDLSSLYRAPPGVLCPGGYVLLHVTQLLWIIADWVRDLCLDICRPATGLWNHLMWEPCVIIKLITSSPWDFECETCRDGMNTKRYTGKKKH